MTYDAMKSSTCLGVRCCRYRKAAQKVFHRFGEAELCRSGRSLLAVEVFDDAAAAATFCFSCAMTSTELLLSELRPHWRDDARAGAVVCVSIIVVWAVIADWRKRSWIPRQVEIC